MFNLLYDYAQVDQKVEKGLEKSLKALNGIQWEVAHPLTLNYGAPIPSMDATMCVSNEGTPYVGIPLRAF